MEADSVGDSFWGETVPEERLPAARAALAQTSPEPGPGQTLRHNATFAHPFGMPGSDVRAAARASLAAGVPDRPWMSGCRYHDMVRETIYSKASQDFERLKHHVEHVRHKNEAELAEFAATRFSKQRATAALWCDMGDTFRNARGLPGISCASPPEAPGTGASADSAPSPLAPSSSSAPSRASASRGSASASSRAGGGGGRVGRGPGSASYEPRKSSSMPSLQKVPYIRAGHLVKDGGRWHGRTSVGLATPTDFVPFKQVHGTRSRSQLVASDIY